MKLFSSKPSRLAAAVLVGALTLAACSSTSDQGSATSSTSDQPATWAEVEAAANEEGSVTYYVAYFQEAQINQIKEAFAKDYPDITIDAVLHSNPSGVSTRVSTEQDGKQFVGDVADAAAATVRQWNAAGYTQVFKAPAAEATTDWVFPPVGDDGNFTGIRVSYNPLWVNTNLIPAGQEPKTHQDLTDPKYKGQIVWHAPWAQGTGTAEMYFSEKVYGPEWTTAMQQQQVSFGVDYPGELNQLARGEYAIALGNPGGTVATSLIAAGDPVKAVWLQDFTQGQAAGLALLNEATHSNAGRVLINWFLTDAGQATLRAVGHWSLRSDVPQGQEWMQGAASIPKERFDSDYGSDVLVATQKAAEAAFKN